jgi:uncharacterized membrane protein YccC
VNAAVRKALRVAIVMPALYALMLYVADDPYAALFGAFGCFALLVFADFRGLRPARARTYLIATALGAVLVSLGTVLSEEFVLAALVMVVVAFVIRYLGVFGGAWAAGANAIILAYVLAATVPDPAADVGQRVLGWTIGGLVATVAAVVLWPVFERNVLRLRIADAVRATAALVRAYWEDEGDRSTAHDAALASVAAMREALESTTFRPSGPAVRDRAMVAVVEGVERLVSIVGEEATDEAAGIARNVGDCLQLCAITAAVLDDAASMLEGGAPIPDYLALESARADQLITLDTWTGERLQAGDAPEVVVTRLEAVFWTRITSYLALGIAADSAIARGGTAAQSNVTSALHTPVVTFGSLRERVTYLLRAHGQVRSARFADAARAGIGLGIAVLVAGLTGVDHGFWVVLGTLSVLRSNALATGRTAFEAVGGTLIGFVVITPCVVLFGDDTDVLWILLPITVFLAAYAPTAISFLIGQAGFTSFVVVLFTIVEPEGVDTGIARVQDIAIGAALSVVVGLLLWPRGARGMMRRALADQCRTDAEFLDRAMTRIVGGTADTDAARTRAVEAGLRAGEAFDQLKTEPGARAVDDETVADVAVSARRVRAVAELMCGQADLGFVVERPEARDALRDECHVLSEVLRRDGDAIADGAAAPPVTEDPPIGVRNVAVDALVAWGGEGPGLAALGALWAWEWVRLVHLALVRAEPGVVAIAASVDAPWWR